jgi:hypothetical protein
VGRKRGRTRLELGRIEAEHLQDGRRDLHGVHSRTDGLLLQIRVRHVDHSIRIGLLARLDPSRHHIIRDVEPVVVVEGIQRGRENQLDVPPVTCASNPGNESDGFVVEALVYVMPCCVSLARLGQFPLEMQFARSRP